MDFTKYVSLLDSEELYFARSDRLGDPFEGSSSKVNKALRPQVYGKKLKKQLFDELGQFAEWIRYWTYVNCWHINEYESAAMWRLYAHSNEAIAIQSTYARFCEVLPKEAHVGVVKYIDYDRDWLPEGNIFYPFMHKRRSFEHERELRAIIQDIPNFGKGDIMGEQKGEEKYMVPVLLRDLIMQVFVAPTSPDWLVDLLEKVTGRYGFAFPVNRSSLDEKPVY